LQRNVFPRLPKLCEENNARFQAIDLRWGVRDEAALGQQIRDLAAMEARPLRSTTPTGCSASVGHDHGGE
jgi:hypothetical protein